MTMKRDDGQETDQSEQKAFFLHRCLLSMTEPDSPYEYRVAEKQLSMNIRQRVSLAELPP
jgi:hypothetical protein